MTNLHDYWRRQGPWVRPADRVTRRHYTPDRLGPRCPVCGLLMPVALTVTGSTTHPTCAA